MKILYVTDFYKPHIGGVEKLFSSLAEELAKNGHQVTFLTWKYHQELPEREQLNGVNIIRIPSPSRMLFSLVALPLIVRLARKNDLIHTSTYSSAIGAWLGSRITRKKIIITVHEVWGDLWLKMPFLSSFEKRVFRTFERWLLRLKFDHYIAVSEFTKNKLIETGINSVKITRIYNGVEYATQKWVDPGIPFTFCFFGRSGASKGLDILIDAAEKFIQIHPGTQFKFIISPQIKKVYKQVISRIKSGSLSNCSDIFSQLSYPSLMNELLKSNCVIIPSLCEGFGFTAVEASSMKIPVISSGMGSLPEVVSGKVITMREYNVKGLISAMEAAVSNQFETIPEKKFSVGDFIKNHLLLYLQYVAE